jgi:hypothetical protein
VFNYLKKAATKYKLSKEINKFDSIIERNLKIVDAVEFELPENAQYNPRIPELIHGKVES